MAKVGCLKPFRGAYNDLKNYILESGEIALDTTNKSMYMGDGINPISSMAPFISGTRKDISYADYQQLSPAEKTNGLEYYIPDAPGSINVNSSVITPTENNVTSSRHYNIGDYFISVDTLLCKATKEINVGDTISVGTGANDNCVSTSVGNELSSLNSKISIITGSIIVNPSPITLSYTGMYLTIPPRTYAIITGWCIWANASPMEAALSFSKSGDIYARFAYNSQGGGVCGSYHNDSTSSVKVYLHGKWGGASANDASMQALLYSID